MLNIINYAKKWVNVFNNGALCHLGNELLYSGICYWKFYPPNYEQITGNFKWLYESGIFFRMVQEYQAFDYSVRVLDKIGLLAKLALTHEIC